MCKMFLAAKRSYAIYTNRSLQAEETSPNSRYPAKSVLLAAICLSKRVILYCFLQHNKKTTSEKSSTLMDAGIGIAAAFGS